MGHFVPICIMYKQQHAHNPLAAEDIQRSSE